MGTAAQRGAYIHALLEHLPRHRESMWRGVAHRLRDSHADLLNDVLEKQAYQESMRILQCGKLANLFDRKGLSEVAFCARPELFDKPLLGIIDRLIVGDGEALAVDFKSNLVIPDRAEQVQTGILMQMGAYQLALEEMYPEESIRVAILWTRSAKLMHIPRQVAIDALAGGRDKTEKNS